VLPTGRPSLLASMENGCRLHRSSTTSAWPHGRHAHARLLRAGLIHTRRDGTRVIYRLASPRVAELWAAVRDVASEHAAALDDLATTYLATTYLGDRSRLQTMTREQLTRALHVGDVVVLDVRPEAEYAAGHIAGALSVPVTHLAARLRDLPSDRTVVAYCRGPYCVYADDAVRALTRCGYRAARLEAGYPEWASAGLPIGVPELDAPTARRRSVGGPTTVASRPQPPLSRATARERPPQ
jgi:rhodanese-related sulfurtransferase